MDTETTGLSPRWDSVVEIGALKFKSGELIDEFQIFVDPGRPIPKEAVSIHGITDDMVKGASSLEEALDAFGLFWGDEPLVLHNPKFDLSFLDGGMSLQDEGWLKAPVFDTCFLSRKAYPGMKSYSLESLARHFSMPDMGHHRALKDCRYCHLLFELTLCELDPLGFMDMACFIDQYSYRR